MKKLLFILLLVVSLAPSTFALTPPAQSPAVLPQDVNYAVGAATDWMSTLFLSAGSLVTTGSPFTLQVGYWILGVVGLWELLKSLRNSLLVVLNPHFHVPIGSVVIGPIMVILKVLIARWMLDYFLVPIPGLGINFHQIFPYFAQALTKGIDQTAVKQVLGDLGQVSQLVGVPGNPFNVLAAAAYLAILFLMGLVQIGMVIITGSSFVFVGIYAFLGPLFIPFFASTSRANYFWDWVDGIFGYSMYRVIGVAISVIFSGMWLNFFNHTIAGDYSIASFLAHMPLLVLNTAVFLVVMFQAPAISNRLFGGKAELGQAFSNTLLRTVERAFSR